jgi:hypothetical protein
MKGFREIHGISRTRVGLRLIRLFRETGSRHFDSIRNLA